MRTILSILMIIASVAGFVMFIIPQAGNLKELRAEQREYDVALANAKELQEAREDLLEQFNQFDTNDLQDLETLLPKNIDNVKLIIELDSLAAQYGMALQDVAVNEGQQTSSEVLDEELLPYGTVNLEFSVAGPYDRFVSFIENIETSLRLIDIYQIEFQTPLESNNYQYKVYIKTYWLK